MKKFLFSILLILVVILADAQNDTLIINKNTILVGEIKDMDKGVLTFETAYSDSDFKIEWLTVTNIISNRDYRIILSDGTRLYGAIRTDTSDATIIIDDNKIGLVRTTPSAIIYLKHVSSGNIFDVINLSMDIGYTFTKANSLHQLNSDIKGDYYSNIWGIKAYTNTVHNTQKDAVPTKRTNAGTGLKLFFKRDYFAAIDADYFSNNEQNLNLRSNYNVSIGKYFIHTNHIYLNTSTGIAYSFENYNDTLTDRKSVEGKLGIELNMFDTGDLSFFTNLIFYPSITEKYRLRTTINLTSKYELLNDFYIKLSLDYNYDTKPIDGIDPDDYVISTGIGWEL